MKGDEFNITPEDINEKFDVLIEGHKSLREQFAYTLIPGLSTSSPHRKYSVSPIDISILIRYI